MSKNASAFRKKKSKEGKKFPTRSPGNGFCLSIPLRRGIFSPSPSQLATKLSVRIPAAVASPAAISNLVEEQLGQYIAMALLMRPYLLRVSRVQFCNQKGKALFHLSLPHGSLSDKTHCRTVASSGAIYGSKIKWGHVAIKRAPYHGISFKATTNVNDPGSIDSSLMQSMEQKIKEQLNAESVIVRDAYGDGRHVRQRMVYKAIWEELQTTVHAVDQMTTKTPAEVAEGK
ncbi:hypothetical protein Ancab_022641 [Ancistrocladus abbreviatus]